MSGIVIVAAGVSVFSVISAYIYGKETGSKKTELRSKQAFVETLERLSEAHKSAGITVAQVKKINQYLSKEIMADTESYGR